MTIALGLVSGLAGRVLAIPELFGLAAAAVVIALAALVRVRTARACITVSASVLPPVVYAGEEALLEIVVEQSSAAGSLATSLVLVRDDSQGPGLCQPDEVIVPGLLPGERARASFLLPTGRRGLIDAGGYIATLTDPLGLARRPLATSRAARCVVLPRVEPLATVIPTGLVLAGGTSTRSATERLTTGSSTLRRYVQGDDLRLVHWPTTARVGELMVREGGDSQDFERTMVTLLLEPGDETTTSDERDRAVEVAASVLSAAADSSSARVGAAWRLVTTNGLDISARRGSATLEAALIALAGLAAARGAAEDRLSTAAGRLDRPDADEVIFVVGAFGASPVRPELLERLAGDYAAVVVVLVTAARIVTAEETDDPRPQAKVLSLTLRLGESLASIWGAEPESDREAFAYGRVGGDP